METTTQIQGNSIVEITPVKILTRVQALQKFRGLQIQLEIACNRVEEIQNSLNQLQADCIQMQYIDSDCNEIPVIPQEINQVEVGEDIINNEEVQ